VKPFMNRGSTRESLSLVGAQNSTQRRQPLPGLRWRSVLVVISLALIVTVAFMPALNNGFVNWDDDENFLDNPFYRGLGLGQMTWACTTFWLGVYQPLAWLLFEAQYVFWKLDPRGYHLTSLILHAANAVVLYLLTVTLLVRCQTDLWLKSPWMCTLGAGLATALFAVHPLRVEVVAWASCQPYLPCAFFSMLTIVAYLHVFESGTSPRRGWLAVTFALFVAALLSHAIAVTLPAVLVILDIYPLRRFGDGSGRWFGRAARRAWREKVPFILASLVFVRLAIVARSRDGFLTEQADVSTRIARACYAIWFYVFKTLLPLDLVAVYPLPRKIDWLTPPFMLSILATLGLSVGLFLLRRRWPGLLAVWLSYLVILAPNSGIIRFSDQIAADRYSYIAMLGWVIAVAACLCRVGQTSSRPRPAAMGIIALGLATLPGLVVMTRDQCRTWHDTKTLWTYALTCWAGANSAAHSKLGHYLFRRGNLEAATAHYTAALRLDPGDVDVYNNLGVALAHQGKFAEAVTQYGEAMRLNPTDVAAHYNLGVTLSRQGKDAEAATQYAEVLRLNPRSVDAHYNLGVVLSHQRKYAEAEAHYREALRLNHTLVDAHNNLGIDLSRQGRFTAAEAHYTEALRLNPHRVDIHTNLGVVLSRQGRFEEAATHYAEALRLNPGYDEAREKLETDRAHRQKLEASRAH
jgi:protein O-mannosyl-transferase